MALTRLPRRQVVMAFNLASDAQTSKAHKKYKRDCYVWRLISRPPYYLEEDIPKSSNDDTRMKRSGHHY